LLKQRSIGRKFTDGIGCLRMEGVEGSDCVLIDRCKVGLKESAGSSRKVALTNKGGGTVDTSSVWRKRSDRSRRSSRSGRGGRRPGEGRSKTELRSKRPEGSASLTSPRAEKMGGRNGKNGLKGGEHTTMIISNGRQGISAESRTTSILPRWPEIRGNGPPKTSMRGKGSGREGWGQDVLGQIIISMSIMGRRLLHIISTEVLCKGAFHINGMNKKLGRRRNIIRRKEISEGRRTGLGGGVGC
jgi:hypothetical protein